MDLSDAELMGRLARGEDLALNSLMDRWGARITSFLHKMTGNRETADDLAQETFVKLYQSCARYRPSGSFSTYLFTIASNLARNHARWRIRHPALELDAAADGAGHAALEPADPGKTPEEAAQASERAQAIDDEFLKLPDDLREAMSLFIYEDMSYADIAAITRCSPKAVETRIYRARQILKERLKHFGS
ncbi:sigma-70 family RNA polymerase sigma factor [Haloferula sp. BvORR071]|uniref:RNA polymerase sigma factor n=1 Tax=Haloferula sp. BvORR071 TaxID=1396141 RepID=UPI0006983E49|nr:sigma-70 family RNA polymerase sigma factor [Haloferula sp. BvORR071]